MPKVPRIKTAALQAFPHLCWFPLPFHSDQVELVRQAMHSRHTTVYTIEPGTTLYTNRSCDNPRCPFTARAAWAVVQCKHPLTISRAELYATLVAAEESYKADDDATAFVLTPNLYLTYLMQLQLDRSIHPHIRGSKFGTQAASMH